MLQIKTTSGETLIHADQRPDTYNGRSYDGSQYMVHAGEWGHHKYIRKEGNRYIYPEDLQKKAQAGVQRVKQKAKEIYDDRKIYGDAAKNMASDGAKVGKQVAKAVWNDSKIGKAVNLGQEAVQGIADYKKRRKDEASTKPKPEKPKPHKVDSQGYEYDELGAIVVRGGKKEEKQHSRPTARKRKVVEGGMNVKIKDKRTTLKQIEKDKDFVKNSPKEGDKLSVGAKESDQVVSAHQGSTGKNYYDHFGDNKKVSKGAKSLDEQKRKTAVRKIIAENKDKTEAQRKSAHSGHENRQDQIHMSKERYLEKMSDPEYVKKRAKKAENGIFDDTTRELQKQKDKTKARKIIAANKSKTDVQAANAHRGANDPRRKMVNSRR